MSSDLYNYEQITDSDDQSSDSDAEVEQNKKNKRRNKGNSPNLEDFLPSEKRAKYTKKIGKLLPGQSLQFGTGGQGAAGQQREEQDDDSDLEILREEAAQEESLKEKQQRELLNAKQRENISRAAPAAVGQPEENWKDRQLVARSRAWLDKKADKDDDDDIEVVLGDTSDEDSPPKKTNNRSRNQQPPPRAPSVELQEEDPTSPDFTTAVPSASKGAITIRLQDKSGHELQCRVKMKNNFSKLFKEFKRVAVANGWLPAATYECRFIFDGDVVKETDTPTSLDLEDDDQIEVLYT